MDFAKVLEINPMCQIITVNCKVSDVGGYFIYNIHGFVDMDAESYIRNKVWLIMKDKSFILSFISSDYLDIQPNTYIRLDNLYHKRFSKFEK